MTAEELRMVTDVAREITNHEIFKEIRERALNGYYFYAGYDSLEEKDIVRLKDKGFKVTIGQNKRSPWFIVEW